MIAVDSNGFIVSIVSFMSHDSLLIAQEVYVRTRYDQRLCGILLLRCPRLAHVVHDFLHVCVVLAGKKCSRANIFVGLEGM